MIVLPVQNTIERPMLSQLQRTVSRIRSDERPDGAVKSVTILGVSFPEAPNHEPVEQWKLWRRKFSLRSHSLHEVQPPQNGRLEMDTSQRGRISPAKIVCDAPPTSPEIRSLQTYTLPTEIGSSTTRGMSEIGINGTLTDERRHGAMDELPQELEMSGAITIEAVAKEVAQIPGLVTNTTAQPPSPQRLQEEVPVARTSPSTLVECQVKSSDVRVFKRCRTKCLYIGVSESARLPDNIVQKWESDKRDQLRIDLADVVSEVYRKVAKKGLKEFEANIAYELRMSGYALNGADTVTLSPCIWILCGSKWAARIIQKAVQEYTWIKSFTPSAVEVHVDGAILATSEQPGPGIEILNMEHGITLAPGVLLYVHVEDYTGKSSACGLLCCATIQHGQTIVQQFCRVGGLITLGDADERKETYGLSTAHSMLSNPSLLPTMRRNEYREISRDYQTWVRNTETPSAGPSDDDDDDDGDGDESEQESKDTDTHTTPVEDWSNLPQEQRLGYRDPNIVTQWRDATSQLWLRFNDRRISRQRYSASESTFDHTLCNKGAADHAILSLDPGLSNPLSNTYIDANNIGGTIRIKSHATEDDLVEGSVDILSESESPIRAKLIVGSTNFVVRGETFTLRKIDTGTILANGTSGSWVVKDGVLYGIIIAVFTIEPFALMMTATRAFGNIQADRPSASVINVAATHSTSLHATDIGAEHLLPQVQHYATPLHRYELDAEGPLNTGRHDFFPVKPLKATRTRTTTEKGWNPSSAPQPTQNAPEHVAGWRRTLIIASIFLSILAAALDSFTVVIAIPTISDEFQSFNDIGWYGSAYQLFQYSSHLLFLRTFLFLRAKWTFLTSLLLFGIGSAVSGAAPSSIVFIVGRAFAGIGAAGILDSAGVIINHILSSSLAYQGLILGLSSQLARAAAPVLGGVLTVRATWRWCFYVNLSLVGVVAAVILFFMQNFTPYKSERSIRQIFTKLDYYGIAAIVSGSICLLLGLNWGGVIYPWNSIRIILLFTFGGLLLLGFVPVQIRMPTRATFYFTPLKQRSVLAVAFVGTCLRSHSMIFMYFLPLWFQGVQGVTALESGIRFLPTMLSMTVAFLVTPVLVHPIRYYPPIIIPATCMAAVGAGLLYTLKADAASSKWIGYQALYGLGTGSVGAVIYSVVELALPANHIRVGMALLALCDLLGGTLAISIAQNVLSRELLWRVSRIPGLGSETVLKAGATSLTDLPASSKPMAIEAYNESLRQVYFIGLIFSCLSVLGAVALEWRKVKTVPAQAT